MSETIYKNICPDNHLNAGELRDYYIKMLLAATEWIVSRFYNNSDYNWIDTKVDLTTGQDFSDDDFLRGKQTVYGWIQGRALEALTGHAIWLRQFPGNAALAGKIQNIIKILYDQLEKARCRNNGHLYFFMNTDGRAFKIENNTRKVFGANEISSFNYSDLFCAKGMYAAAKYMEDAGKIEASRRYCEDVVDNLWAGNFISDQYAFNAGVNGMDCITKMLGPYMLCLNMVANMLVDDGKYASAGMKLLSHILERHINSPAKWQFGREYDCVEIVNDDGLPLLKNGVAISDSGHALEFTGLALKFLNALKNPQAERLQPILSKILIQNFNNGFVRNPGGICKRYDIVERRVLDSYMPWWSLPETMRAVCYAIDVCENSEMRSELLQIFFNCHNSFSRNFVRPEFNYTAFQAIGTDGKPVKIVPATPDADPGYHTGLSMIDCLNRWPFHSVL